MQAYSVQFEDRTSIAPKTIVVGRADDLTNAIKLLESAPIEAYIAYIPDDLQRRIFNGKIVWLDVHGQEVAPPPRSLASSRSR